jgi:hypothetical protein
MSTSPAEFLKWLTVFNVPYGGGYTPISLPLVMSQGGTGSNLTPANNSLFYSTATQAALLATTASRVLVTDTSGNLMWSTMLPAGTQSASPSVSTDIVNKAYVDNLVAGLNPAASVNAASTAELSGYTYNNGSSGVGATLTAPSNGVFIADGVTVPIGEPFLYKNDIAGGGAYNGVYIITTSSAGSPAVLTRAVYYDTPININDTGIIPVINGTVNQQSGWLLVTNVITVGTSPLTYIQFGQTAGIIPLSNGGTNNNITPSNGGIVYSSASKLDVLAGTPTANLPLLSGSNTIPHWGSFALNLGGVLTTAGAVTFQGAFPFQATLTGATSVTFPTSGTLAKAGVNADITSMTALNGPLRAPTGIEDASGAFIVGFGTPGGTPVNYFIFQNNITGETPSLFATGTDTNVGMVCVMQAAGQFGIQSTNNTPLVLYSGTLRNHITNFIFANTAGTRNVTFPDASGTLLMSTVAATLPSLAFVDYSTGGIVGTLTNNNAAAGYQGEFLDSGLISTVGITTSNVAQNMTSLLLTPGDWDVYYQANIQSAATVTGNTQIGLSTTSATFSGTFGAGNNVINNSSGSFFNNFFGYKRFSVAVNTTVFLVASQAFAVGTPVFNGQLMARRPR